MQKIKTKDIKGSWKDFIYDIKSYYHMIRTDPMNMWYYIQGNVRMFLFKNLPNLVKGHIKEQFKFRMKAAEPCTLNGSCLICGCSIKKGLYFASKGCAKEKTKDMYVRKELTGSIKVCYPPLMNAYEWELYKLKNKIKI